ncbi:MAG: YchJ family protein [Vibrio sp.]
MNTCQCGSETPYANCCEPIHLNPSRAVTPEQLMRARYCAHARGLVDFVVETYHPSCHAELEREQIAASIQNKWLKLEVLGHSHGSDENEGYVHFKAHFFDGQQSHCLEENSRFLRENGRWYYIDGEFPETKPPLKIGRNDPCVCGSGKKFKKCCG